MSIVHVPEHQWKKQQRKRRFKNKKQDKKRKFKPDRTYERKSYDEEEYNEIPNK